ncbi:uncharacterized protein LOC128557158 [Mercenaria mercenaria]|uniref:uncharacterized protein LOC128557158 n=1 Tax=Mercenaria mercenaria TaxID=6596 RepID=UPI00234F3215|nr:uncharacterized protein LOC128557158 [Mercenaria mercenaria]
MEKEQKEFSNWVQNINALQITKVAFHEFAIDKLAAEMRTWKISDISEFLQFINDIEQKIVEKPNKSKPWQCKAKHETCETILNSLMQIRQNQTFNIRLENELCKQLMLGDSAEETRSKVATIPKIKKPDALKLFRAIFGNSRKASPGKAIRKGAEEASYDDIFKGCRKRHIWCIANMFMQDGTRRTNIYNTEPANTDAAMFFKMMKNCKLFIASQDDSESKIAEVIECRNRLFHSPNNRVQTPDADANFTTLINLLKQYDDIPSCRDAIQRIDDMRGQTIVFGTANKTLVKKAWFLKSFELETDLEIERSKGYSCDEIEELLEETKEQFSNQSLLHYSGTKSTEEYRKENEEYEEEIQKIKNDVTRIEIQDLMEELKEQYKQVAKMSEKDTDDPNHKTEIKDLQQKLKNVRSELDKLNEKRIQVAELKDENRLTTEFKESIEEIRKDFRNEQKILQKELSELRKQTQQNDATTHLTETVSDLATSSPQQIVHEKETDLEAHDSEDWYCDIDELDSFEDKDETSTNNRDMLNEPKEASNLPFETFSRSGKRVIASVTFGRTFTQFIVLPSKYFTTEQNFGYSSLVQMLSSTILLNQKKEVEEYGAVAKEKYDDLNSTQKREQYFYFESLKINNSVGLTDNLQIEDVRGRSMNAVDVYSAAIKYIKVLSPKSYKETIRQWNDRFSNISEDDDRLIPDEPISEDDIFWVFTEPAVSDGNVKSCITEAAEKSGIRNEHVAVIPEPVAALAYCMHTPEKWRVEPLSIEKYTKYLIVNFGEQTVTISTCEAIDQSTFKEMDFPVEYTVKTDVAYEDFVTEVIGKKALGKRSSSETDVIVLVGPDEDVIYYTSNLRSAIKRKFPQKRIYIPADCARAVIVGAAHCCYIPMTLIK